MTTICVPMAVLAQSSPFAGDDTPRASKELSFPAPTYEATTLEAPAAALSTNEGYSVRGATSLNQSLAGVIMRELPEGVSLDVSGADESFVTIGAAAPSSRSLPFQEDMDNEQAVELIEEIDSEQAQELGGGDVPATVGKFIVHYPVAFRNIPVSKFADVTAFVSEGGDVQSLRTRNLPKSLDADIASVTTDAALAAAIADAGGWADGAEISGPSVEVWVDEGGVGHLSYRIELTDNGAEPNARRYWIAATGDGEVIYWESMIHHQHFGNVKGTVWSEAGTPTGPTTSLPLSDMTVERSLGGGSRVTNSLGNYAFPTGGGVRTMTGTLSGPNSVVTNIAGAEMTRNRNGSPTVAADLNFNASGAEQIAQDTAFYWTNRAYDLAKDILDPGELANLPTNVNRPGSCNAFWNGSSINFYVAGGNCPNMAYDSVVLHEYGHGVDARKGGIVNGGYSEGFGDAMSILGTRESCVGQDFFGPNTCLRDAKDLIMWPLGSDGVHAQGRRYAGFTWELTQQLKTLYAEDTAFEVARQLTMGAAKANPSDIPDAVLLSFVVDDDDGDLTNGTPHFKQLAAAADSRNLPRPADPIKNVRRMGFAWANSPTSASYTPSTTYSYNSANGPITARRLGVGDYEVKFAGLGGQGRAGGNVQVTGYGSSSNDCKVRYWSSSSSDFIARVKCLSPSGAAVNDRFTILITWP